MRFEVKFLQNDRSFFTDLHTDSHKIDTEFSEFQEISVIDEIEAYDGPYVVTPAIDSQVLSTAQKRMIDNMTVKAIPYFQTSNPQMGETVYIGSEVEIHGS